MPGKKPAQNQVFVAVKVEENLKEDCAALFASWGLNMNSAIRIFLLACRKEGKLPFEIK